jgi:intermembrane space import and assembly protein 40
LRIRVSILPIMFRPAARALARAPTVARGPASTRLISTGPSTGPSKSRSWKNTAVRLGLAVGAVYYYNTSSVFAQEPSCTSCRAFFSSGT